MKNSEVLIRSCNPGELGEVAELWFEVSTTAHDFISPEFWGSNKIRMATEYLPAAETLVAVKGNEILGFISLVGDHLAALFIRTSVQGMGVGSLLLDEVRKNRPELTLKVYKKNRRSLHFYQNKGFRITSEEIDPETGEKEFLMKWKP